LRSALTKRTKTELIDFVVQLAADDQRIVRQIEAHFQLEFSPPELAVLTRQAIAAATYYDKRDNNRNFLYDHEAYDTVKRNLSRLIQHGQMPLAMELSLELMDQGSEQVAMSDEGLMTEEIQACLQVVIQAVATRTLPADRLLHWCHQMREKDQVGFICDRELHVLCEHLKASQTQ
jgi:hypothetical protein